MAILYHCWCHQHCPIGKLSRASCMVIHISYQGPCNSCYFDFFFLNFFLRFLVDAQVPAELLSLQFTYHSSSGPLMYLYHISIVMALITPWPPVSSPRPIMIYDLLVEIMKYDLVSLMAKNSSRSWWSWSVWPTPGGLFIATCFSR